MTNASVVDQIVKSLSFEVEAVPQEDNKLASTSNTTPLNVKIRVRKKNESGIQHGVLSVPKFGRPDAQPERIRLISSDQTIISFNMSMETDLVKKSKRKPRKSFFARCLGSQYDDDEIPYTPTAYNAKISDANTTSMSDGVIRQNFTLSKTKYDNADVDHQTHTKKHGILGKCKPGGCLDPPFGEEKYSYEPTQKLPGINEDTIKKPKKIKVSKMVTDQRNITVSNELSMESIVNKTKIKSQDKSDSILSLYNNSLVGSLDSKYSDSVITYPPLTNTNSNEKSSRNRISNEDKPRKSFDDSIEAFFNSKTNRLNEKSSNDADNVKKEKAKVIPVPIPITLGNNFVKGSEKTQISAARVSDFTTKKGTLVESDSTVMEHVNEMLDTNDAKCVAPLNNNKELFSVTSVTDATVKSQIEMSGIQTHPVDLFKPKIDETPEDKHNDMSSYHTQYGEVTLPLLPLQDDQCSVKILTLFNEIPISVQEEGQTKEKKGASPPLHVQNDQSSEKTSRPLHNEMPMSVQEKKHEVGESLSLISNLDKQALKNFQENRDLISSARGSTQDGCNFTIDHTVKPYDENDHTSKRPNADHVMVSDYDKMLKENIVDEFDKLTFLEENALSKGITQSDTDTKSIKQNEQPKEIIKPQSLAGEVTPHRQNETRKHENIQENLNLISNTGISMLDDRIFEQSDDDHIMASDYDVNDKMQDDYGLDEYKLSLSEKNSPKKDITQLETDTKVTKQIEQGKEIIKSQSPVGEATPNRQYEPRQHENIQENRDFISTGGSMVDGNYMYCDIVKPMPFDQNDNISKQSDADYVRTYDMNANELPINTLDKLIKLSYPEIELLDKGITQSENERISNIISSDTAVNASTKHLSEADQYFTENMNVNDSNKDTKIPDKDYVKNEIILQENYLSPHKNSTQSNKNLLHNENNVLNNDDDNYHDMEPSKYSKIIESSKEVDDFSPLTDRRHNEHVDGISAHNIRNLNTVIHSSQAEQLKISNSIDGLENLNALTHDFASDEDNIKNDIPDKVLHEDQLSEILINGSKFMEPITRSTPDKQQFEKSKSIIENQSVKSERSDISHSNALKYKFKTNLDRTGPEEKYGAPQVVSKSSLKKNFISLDMAFQSYVNEKRERIFKTLDTSVESTRYPNDSVTVLQSPLRSDSNEIRIPIDLENDMTIQIHRTKSPTQRVQILKQEPFASDNSFTTLKGNHGLSDFPKTKCESYSKRWNGIFTGNDIPNILDFVYEQELLPLQKTIKNLNKEVDLLISHQSTLVDKLISSKRTKPFRLLKVNSRCVCCRPRIPKVVDLHRVSWSGQKHGVRGCKWAGTSIATWGQSP